MERELHRGRLIDHIQLVVKDIDASRRFYAAIFGALAIPIAGEAPDHIWADELFISTADSEAAQGQLTGRRARGALGLVGFADLGGRPLTA